MKLGALYGAPLAWLLTGEGKAPGARTIKRSVDAARGTASKAVAA